MFSSTKFRVWGAIAISILALALSAQAAPPGEDDEIDPDENQFQSIELSGQQESQADVSFFRRRFEQSLGKPPEDISIENDSGLFTRLVILGQNKKLYDQLSVMMNRLGVKHDSTDFFVRLSASPYPNAEMETKQNKQILSTNLGLFAFVENPDELAAVIAHEMTHSNPELLKTNDASPDIDAFLREIPEFAKHMDSPQYGRTTYLEEMRADLGAIDRLIKGGYNPWAYFDVLERAAKMNSRYRRSWLNRLIPFDKLGMQEDKTHPSDAVRLPTIKAWIARRKRKLGLTAETGKYSSFEGALRHVRRAAKEYTTFTLIDKWPRRFVGTAALVAAIHASGLDDPATLDTLLHSADPSAAWETVKSHFEKMSLSAGEALDNKIGGTLNASVRQWDKIFLTAGTIGTAVTYLALRYLDNPNIVLSLDSANKIRRTLRRSLPKFLSDLRQNPRPLDEKGRNELVGAMDSISSLLSEAEYVFAKGHGTKWLSHLDGLQKDWRTGISYYKKLLNEIESQLSLLPRRDARYLRTDIQQAVDRLPEIVLETYPDQRKQLARVLKLDLYQVTDIETYLKRRENLPYPIRKLILLQLADGVGADTPPAEVLQIVAGLSHDAVYDTANSLLKTHYDKIHSFVTSKENTDPSLPQILVETQERLSKNKSLGTQGRIGREAFGRRMMWETWKSTEPAKKIAAACLSFECAPEKSFIPALRYWVNKMDHAMIRKLLADRFDSLTELKDFIKSELAPRHPFLERIRYDLFEVVKDHPEWIQDVGDVESLVELESIWPTFRTDETANQAPQLARTMVSEIRRVRHKFPSVWKYDPGSAEKLHKNAYDKLKANKIYPETYDEKLKLWGLLTKRGVTSTSDRIFSELYDEASPLQKGELQLASTNGRIWEPELGQRVAWDEIQSSITYQKLMQSQSPTERHSLLTAERHANGFDGVIQLIKNRFPDRGLGYRNALEKMSWAIRSSALEADLIEKEKQKSVGSSGKEFGLRLISELLDEAHTWSLKEQWELIRFLREEAPPSRRIAKDFERVGTERLQRAWSVLPTEVRAGILDGYLHNPDGLLPQVDSRSGYGKVIIDHLLREGSPEAQLVGRQVLEGFLHALNKTGDSKLRSTTLAYLLAQPKGKESVGETLKNIFEFFGAAGVKIGQFIAAAEILPDEETRVLRDLHEKASKPSRAGVYQDMKELAKGHTVQVEDLAGAASMKYAVRARLDPDAPLSILKVLRQEAITDTDNQFNQLEEMADYLVKNHGSKFGVLKAIVRASRRAVDREKVLKDEVARSELARQHIYDGKSDEAIEIHVPHEKLVGRTDRLISSEIAPGTSIRELPEDLQKLVAAKILQIEGNNLFADNDVIYFDPDRHPGNYRVEVISNGTIKLKLGPIDFGQVLSITKEQRNQVFDLFAVASILKRSGANAWGADRVIDILKLDKGQAKTIRAALAKYFPDTSMKKMTPYFSLLAALDQADVPVDIVYFDYVRAIIQMKQYETLLEKAGESEPAVSSPEVLPLERFEKTIVEHGERERESLHLSLGETLAYGARKIFRKDCAEATASISRR